MSDASTDDPLRPGRLLLLGGLLALVFFLFLVMLVVRLVGTPL